MTGESDEAARTLVALVPGIRQKTAAWQPLIDAARTMRRTCSVHGSAPASGSSTRQPSRYASRTMTPPKL